MTARTFTAKPLTPRLVTSTTIAPPSTNTDVTTTVGIAEKAVERPKPMATVPSVAAV